MRRSIMDGDQDSIKKVFFRDFVRITQEIYDFKMEDIKRKFIEDMKKADRIEIKRRLKPDYQFVDMTCIPKRRDRNEEE